MAIPQAQDRQLQTVARRQGWRAAARASICGYVDAFTLLNFEVYTSFMTGNTTSAGVRLAQQQFDRAGHSLLPIPSFILGVAAATLLQHVNTRRALSRLSAIGGAMILLDVAAIVVHAPKWLSIVILSSAMGVVNTSVPHVGSESVGLGYLTGDLNNLAKQVADAIERKPEQDAEGSWDTPWRRVAVLAGLWVAFIWGALLGGVLGLSCSVWSLVFPAVTLLSFAWWERGDPSDP